MTLTHTITWVACGASLPDADLTVLCYDTETELVCEGWFDGEDDDGCTIWRDVTAVQLGSVTHWAEMPARPTA